jgi:hypothetical protein
MSWAELFINGRVVGTLVSVSTLEAVLHFTERGQKLLDVLHKIGLIITAN